MKKQSRKKFRSISLTTKLGSLFNSVRWTCFAILTSFLGGAPMLA